MAISTLRADPARGYGAVCGTILGLCWVAYALATNLAALDAGAYALLNNGLTAALALAFGVAGLRAAQQTGQVRVGLSAGLWTWLIGASIGLATIWVSTLVFWDAGHHNPGLLADYARSGAGSLDAFLIDDAIGASTFGVAAMLALGLAASAAGGLLGWGLGRRPRDGGSRGAAQGRSG